MAVVELAAMLTEESMEEGEQAVEEEASGCTGTEGVEIAPCAGSCCADRHMSMWVLMALKATPMPQMGHAAKDEPSAFSRCAASRRRDPATAQMEGAGAPPGEAGPQQSRRHLCYGPTSPWDGQTSLLSVSRCASFRSLHYL